MERLVSLLSVGVSFGRNTIGIVTRPYAAYRRIVEHGNMWELVYIGILLSVYFALASVVKTAAFRPFLLTKQFVLLGTGAAVGFAVAVGTFWIAGRLTGGRGSLGKLALAWAYTLVPTVIWFLATSVLYVLLPPPRTTSVAGVAFSILFLVFSVILLWWKLTLSYLSLRFSLRLDLARILLVTAVSAPVLGVWSYTMYRLGIFKVPFL